jgi:protein subunit release factor B
LTSDGSVGTQNINKQDAALRINPTLASTVVVVSANKAITKDALLEVYNLNGQLVSSTTWNTGQTQQEINVEDLVNGVYSVRLSSLPLGNGMIVVNH